MNDEIKTLIKWTAVSLSILSCFFGVLRGLADRWDCKPSSVASMVNIPHRIGCEFVKERDWVR